MPIGNRLPLLLLVALLAAAPRVTLAEQPPVRVYTAADGLAADAVYGILADSRGFLWFRTMDGLSRFNGYVFTTYTTDDGLPDRRVTDILETRAGDYWVATEGGLCRFDPRGVPGSAASPLFVRVRVGEGDAVEEVRVLVETRDGTLWCGTNMGLYRLEARDGQVTSTRIGLETRAGVFAIVEDRGGDVWVGTLENRVLYRVRPGGAVEPQALPELPEGFQPEKLYVDRDGRLWVGSRSGCYYAEPSTGGGRLVFVEPDVGVPLYWTTSFRQTRDGPVLMGATSGLYRIRTTAGRPAFERVASLDSVCDREVWDIAEDRDGNLWLATRCGALRIGQYGFTKYSMADGLASLAINSIFENRAGDVVVTLNYERIVSRFDGTRFTQVTPNVPGADTGGLGWGWGQTVLQDRDGAWWVPTGVGIHRFPSADRPEEALRARPKPIYTGSQVFRAFEDSRGDVWFSTTERLGLFRWERRRDEVIELTSAVGVTGVEYTAFAESRDGAVWIGTSDGLLRYAGGRFTVLGTADGVPAGWLRDLHVDVAGRLWIASSLGGLGRIDDPAAERPVVHVYRRAEGLSTDNIWCVVDDVWGRIYAGTGRGVDRLDPSTGRVHRFTSADGLPKGHVEVCHRDREGRLWFGTAFGLARLDPEPERAREPPRTLVTGLRVDGVARPVSALGEVALPALEFGPGENSVAVDFLGLGTSLGEELRYQSRLEGADQDWSAPAAERTVTFAHLAPGSYHFLVRAVDADERASPEPAVVAFTIAAPVWQRWWFLTLAATLVGLTGYGLHRYRVGRLLEVERVRTRIATDLHDDIGANLTRISVLSEVASYRSGGDDDSLASIARISRESVESMSDIVWAVDPRRDSFRDLVRRMRELADEALTVRGVHVRFSAPEADGELRFGHELRRQFYLIFKEALNNASRHSGCEQVEVAVELDRRGLALEVADDGRGFDPAAGTEGNGLVNMRRRAEAMGARLEVRSAPGTGTTVRLEVPFRRGRPV
jgi:signal transduction histidine kinase/ligand-binding sensor domain-containing protein